jgi:hypothetical protein
MTAIIESLKVVPESALLHAGVLRRVREILLSPALFFLLDGMHEVLSLTLDG